MPARIMGKQWKTEDMMRFPAQGYEYTVSLPLIRPLDGATSAFIRSKLYQVGADFSYGDDVGCTFTPARLKHKKPVSALQAEYMERILHMQKELLRSMDMKIRVKLCTPDALLTRKLG